MTKPNEKKTDFQKWLVDVKKWIREGGTLPAPKVDRLLADRRMSARNY